MTDYTMFDYSPQAQKEKATDVLALIRQEMAQTIDTLYLFVDPVPLQKMEELHFYHNLVDRRPVAARLPHKNIAVADYPWLLALNLSHGTDQALLQQSIDFALAEIHPDLLCRGLGRAICGWLTSPYSVDVVAKQLGGTAIQTCMDRSQILMRYSDPAVHSVLWPQLNDFRQRRWMGVLSRWVFVDGDGQIVVRRHRADRTPHFTFELGLLPEQTDFIVHDIGIINRALRRYRRLTKDIHRYPELHAATLVSAALARQKDHPAFCDDEQKEDLAFHVLHDHPQIDRHPKIDYLLDAHTFSADVPWLMRIADFTPERWKQYARDCKQQFPAEGDIK